MNRFILAASLFFSLQVYASETIKLKSSHRMEYGTICIATLLHSYAVTSKGVSLVQLMQSTDYAIRPNKPVRCNSNEAKATSRKSSDFEG